MNIHTRQNGNRVWQCDDYDRHEVICSRSRFGYIVQEQERDAMCGVWWPVGEAEFFANEEDAVLSAFGQAMELALCLEEQRTPRVINVPAWCQ